MDEADWKLTVVDPMAGQVSGRPLSRITRWLAERILTVQSNRLWWWTMETLTKIKA